MSHTGATRLATSSEVCRPSRSTEFCPGHWSGWPPDLEFTEIPIGSLPLYSADYDSGLPSGARELKEAIARSDAVLFVTPEYNRSIPGALKNAIDWASRPWGENSFHHTPAAVIGASVGAIGTAVAQQSLRAVLNFCNARQMTSPEAYITYSPERFREDGEVIDETTAAFLRDYMGEFRDHIERVLTVLPHLERFDRGGSSSPHADTMGSGRRYLPGCVWRFHDVR